MNRTIIIHRKDGQRHPNLSGLSVTALNRIIKQEKDKYVRLCYKCHKHVHWCMTYLGMDWNEIVQKKGAMV